MLGTAGLVLALHLGECPGELVRVSSVLGSTDISVCCTDEECTDYYTNADEEWRQDLLCHPATEDEFPCCIAIKKSNIDVNLGGDGTAVCLKRSVGTCVNAVEDVDVDNAMYFDCFQPTEAPVTASPAPPAEDSGLSAGAIAGIAVGAVLAVVAAGVWLL